MKRSPRCLVALLLSVAGLFLGGCSSVRFYSEAIAGQAEILSKAQPIERVILTSNLDAEVKRKLQLVQDARRFATEHLGLPAEWQFGRYTDLGRPYVSWVVYAAPEFSVEGKEWWYPIVGRLEYRGFFDQDSARAEAERLKRQGYEVYVGGVEAYSTLGYFRDPVLNTFFRRTDEELVELIFHELTHVKLFLPGDTDFNEAFATATAEAGVVRWLKSKGDLRALAAYRAGLAKDREIIHLLLATRARLARLYRDQSLSAEQMRRAKAEVFAGLSKRYQGIRQYWQGDSRYDLAFAKPWNNARLNTVATYYELVPGFERLLQREQGDWERYFAVVSNLRSKTKEARRVSLLHGSSRSDQ